MPVQIITVIEAVKENKFSDINIEFPVPVEGKRDINITIGEMVDRWTFQIDERNVMNINLENPKYGVYFERLKEGQSMEQHLLHLER